MSKKWVSIGIGWDIKQFSDSTQNLQRKLRKTSRNLKRVGTSMSTAMTLPIAAFGAVSVKVFADFEQSMAKVAAISGATGKPLQDLTKLAKDLGISTRFTASQVAELQLNYSKLGFAPEEIQKITKATLDLALATGEDLANSAEVAGSTLRGFELDATEMVKVVDVMAKSFSSSALDLEKFKTGMAVVAPVAKTANVTLEQTTALMAVLANRGVDASTVGTGLRNIFLDLADKGMSFKDAMDQIQNSSNANATAMELFGKRGATVANIIANNRDEVSKLTETFYDSEGAAKGMADIMDNTLQGSMFKLRSAVEGLGISFGEVLAPHVAKVADFVSRVAIKFSELNPRVKQIIVIVAGLAAAIGPLVLAIGSLTAAFAFLAANPVVLAITGIIVAIGALAAAIYYVRSNAEAFAEYFSNLWVKIKNNVISAIQAIIKAHSGFLRVFGIDLTSSLIGQLESMKGVVKENTKEFDTLGETVDKIKGKLTTGLVLDVGLDAPSGGGNPLSKFLKDRSFLGDLKAKKFEVNIPVKLDLDMSAIPSAIEQIDMGVSELGQRMIQLGEDVKSSLQQFATQTAIFLGESIGNALTGDLTSKDFGKQALAMVGGFMKQMGALMIGYATQMALFSTSVGNPLLWPVALAAGIAMVAAGSAISNLANKGLDAGASGGGSVSTPSASIFGGFDTQEEVLVSTVTLSGRDMILQTKRERAFRR